jgi:hemerythrin superfamily protein
MWLAPSLHLPAARHRMSILEAVLSAVTPSKADGGVDAIDLLKEDHDQVDALLKNYDDLAEANAPAKERRALSTQICGLLMVHAMIEEEIFYPAARSAGVEPALLDEALVEHGSAKDLIAQIGAATADDELYDARVKVLGEYIRHHVKEEEGELFPACRKAEMNLAKIGAQLESRKATLLKMLEDV